MGKPGATRYFVKLKDLEQCAKTSTNPAVTRLQIDEMLKPMGINLREFNACFDVSAATRTAATVTLHSQLSPAAGRGDCTTARGHEPVHKRLSAVCCLLLRIGLELNMLLPAASPPDRAGFPSHMSSNALTHVSRSQLLIKFESLDPAKVQNYKLVADQGTDPATDLVAAAPTVSAAAAADTLPLRQPLGPVDSSVAAVPVVQPPVTFVQPPVTVVAQQDAPPASLAEIYNNEENHENAPLPPADLEKRAQMLSNLTQEDDWLHYDWTTKRARFED